MPTTTTRSTEARRHGRLTAGGAARFAIGGVVVGGRPREKSCRRAPGSGTSRRRPPSRMPHPGRGSEAGVSRPPAGARLRLPLNQ
jgi:hypothetical protein